LANGLAMIIYFYLFLLFASIAAAGVGLAILRRAGVKLPAWLATAHGLSGLLGLAVFFGANLSLASSIAPELWWSLIAFTLGLVGGLLFFRVLFRRQAIPLWAILGHASMAAIGLYLLYFPAMSTL
jgi:hypothetical protein